MDIQLRDVITFVAGVISLSGVYVALDRRVTRIEAAREQEKEARARLADAETRADEATNEGLCRRIEVLEGTVSGLASRVSDLEVNVGAVNSTVEKGFEDVLVAIGKLRPSQGA